ncbi:RICIN domain-containing protein [Streptomyces sp. NPDC101118]|uniref:RICIN domain-containing protein n=1 Tax=Streptomyces sp. NPDC101118 TaxID=3366109 RepID=UPI00380CCB1A
MTLLKRAAAALACSAALLLTLGTAQTAAAQEQGETGTAATYVHIKNGNSGQCLAVPGGSTEAGKGLIQWGCGNWNDHYWSFQYGFTSGGIAYYRLENLNSHQCLAVPGGSKTAGTQVIQWPCGTWNDHYWGVQYTSGGTRLVNYNSGQCLAIPGASTTQGEKVIQWPCGTWRDHYWTW